MRRWIVTVAVLLGLLVFAVEGYYLYRFYTEPGVGVIREPDRPAAKPGTKSAEEPGPGVERETEPRTRPESEPRPEDGAEAQADEARYVTEVGGLQAEAVETFLDSHERLRRYDGLTADDVDALRANRDTMQELAGRVERLDPPQAHKDQYEIFRYAVFRLEEATTIAYGLASDPVSATRSRIETYDQRTEEAATGLRRSNELLGRDYETLGDVQDIGT